MYSGIIEIIGIRDLADISPEIYAQKLNEFYQVLENVYEGWDGGLKIYGHRDYFFYSHKEITSLLEFTQAFRSDLMTSKSILCRGVIMSGEYSLKKPNNQNIDIDFKLFDKFTSSLFGELYNLKGIGVKLCKAVVDDLNQEEQDKYSMRNYYLEDYNNIIFEEFFDLRLQSNLNIEYYEVEKVCKAFEHSNNISAKLARYYIPLFNNIILNWKYKTKEGIYKKISDELNMNLKLSGSFVKIIKVIPYELEVLMYSNYFNKFKKVKGIRLIYLFFLKKLIESELLTEKTDKLSFDDIDYLIKKMRTNVWLINYLKEDALVEAPRSLFDKLTKRKLFNHLGKY